MKVMLTMDDGQNFSGEVEEVPRMYDIVNDTRRAVTQADVDRWLRIEMAFGKVLLAAKEYDRDG